MPSDSDASCPSHSRFSLQHMRTELMRIEHLYNAYLRTGQPRFAKQAGKLTKCLHKEFKQLGKDISVGKDDFRQMMQGSGE